MESGEYGGNQSFWRLIKALAGIFGARHRLHDRVDRLVDQTLETDSPKELDRLEQEIREAREDADDYGQELEHIRQNLNEGRPSRN